MRPVNLLPQEQRRQANGQRPGSAYFVVGGLVLLLVMAVAYVMSSNQVNTRTSEANAARVEADQLDAQTQQLGSFTNFATVKQTRLASVAGVAGTRFDWERLMHEISRLMPEGSWLQTTDASVSGGDANAGANGADPSATPAAPSANFVGCTPKQEDVARMMVRMRRMYRVQDVQLNESSQETTGEGSAASLDSCGRLYKFDITVSFSAVAPPTEAPRGATKVPVSLGGGS